jgi:hypothetical protein
MEEIAQTLASAGLPDGFHEAAAEIFRRSPRLTDQGVGPSGKDALSAVLDALTDAERAG